MKQTDRILKYMNDFGSINQREAMEDLGIFRLASRINDLRGMGYDIETKTEHGRNRYGEKTHWAKYVLNPKPVQTQLFQEER